MNEFNEQDCVPISHYITFLPMYPQRTVMKRLRTKVMNVNAFGQQKD